MTYDVDNDSSKMKVDVTNDFFAFVYLKIKADS